MITLDSVRAATFSDDPYNRMDSLVRAELATGRRVRAVLDDLNPLIDTVLDLPGLSEDGEEAFLGTLDALTGNCLASQRYTDPAAECSVAFADPAAEARGLSFLAGRFAGRVRSNGRHVMPREAVHALIDQNIPFTFVGAAGPEAGG